MIDTDKIKIMTALAVYDDRYGEKDRAAAGHHIRDYVYKNNCVTRILAFFGFLAGLFFYFVHIIALGNIADVDFIALASISLAVLLGILAGYTLLGRHVYKKRYFKAKERLSGYYKLLKSLYRE